MKIMILSALMLSLSTVSFAEAEKAYLQKGAAIEYCIGSSPNSYLVRGNGQQREVTIDIEYSDSQVSMIVAPPYSVGSATVLISSQGSKTYCYILTKL